MAATLWECSVLAGKAGGAGAGWVLSVTRENFPSVPRGMNTSARRSPIAAIPEPGMAQELNALSHAKVGQPQSGIWVRLARSG